MRHSGFTAVRPPAVRKFLTSLVAVVFVVGVSVVVSTARAAPPVAEDLASRWEGQWVVIPSELSSGCAGYYTNNRVLAGEVHREKGGWERKLQRMGRFLVQHSASVPEVPAELDEVHLLAAGELGSVHRVRVTRDRIDLLVDLEGRVLTPYEHGPFTLYREVHCQVQLQFEVPKKVVQRGSMAELEALLVHNVERFATEEEARRSSHWNGRGDDAYPPDYDDTLRAYAAWRNAEIARGLTAAFVTLADLGAELPSSSSYYDGFYRGVNALEPILQRVGCESLVGRPFEDWLQRPRMGEVATNSRVVADVTLVGPGGDRERLEVFSRRGYEDGQRLLYALEMLRRLPACRLAEDGEAR